MIVDFWLEETTLLTTPCFRCAAGGLSEWREWEDCILQNDGVLQPGQLQLAGQNQQLFSVHCKCYSVCFKGDIWTYKTNKLIKKKHKLYHHLALNVNMI